MQRKSKPVEPLTSFTEEGDLIWNANLVEKIREIGGSFRRAAAPPGKRPDHYPGVMPTGEAFET